MAEALGKILGNDIETFSAGSRPSGKVNPKAISSMREIGYDLSSHHSKSIKEIERFAPFDAVVTMGCGDACPWIPAKKHIDWDIPDPKEMNEEDFREVRKLIENKVRDLLNDIR